MKVTSETLTDEQIIELRNEVAPMATPRPRIERTASDLEIIDSCDHALTPYPEYADKRAIARARCAEIINARAAKEVDRG